MSPPSLPLNDDEKDEGPLEVEGISPIARWKKHKGMRNLNSLKYQSYQNIKIIGLTTTTKEKSFIENK